MREAFRNWLVGRYAYKFFRYGLKLFDQLVVRYDKPGEDGDLSVVCFYTEREEYKRFIVQEYESLEQDE